MKVFKYFTLLVFISIIAGTTSCKKDDGDNPKPSDLIEIQNILIETDPVKLNQRLNLRNEVVTMIPEYYSEGVKSGNTEEEDYSGNFAFKLRANVDAPVYEEATLMATHVAIKDNYAFVTYNIRGEQFGGALEVFDVSVLTQPQIVSFAYFPKADINSVDYSNGKVFIAGATEDYVEFGFESPAFFQVLSLDAQMLITDVDTIIDIPSYSANGVSVAGNKIHVTSGDNGGLTIFDMEYQKFQESIIADARSVDASAANVYVLSGQPGKINVFDALSGDFVNQYETGGANTPHSKSKISVNEQYLFAALNEEGARMLNLDGSEKQHFPKPPTPDGELDENHVTNSVAINNSLLFMGNGQSGIAVGELIPELNDSVVMLGTMIFNDMQSANFVQAKDSVVFVASGLGGLKILTISIDEGVPDDIIPTEPCPTLMDSITLFFPERSNAMNNNPGLFAGGISLNVVTAEETPVYVMFVHEGAGWKNTFGYYAYPADNPPISFEELQKYVVFPNVSMVGEGGGLEPGDMVQLGTEPFPANTVIGFYLVAQGWANGQMVDGVYTHYTNIGVNPNNNQQHVLFIESGCQDMVLAFEDIRLPGGDKDFNDIILVIKDNEDMLPNTMFNVEGVVNINIVDEEEEE